MKKYRVLVTETSVGFIYIEAETEVSAKELAHEGIMDGMAQWHDCDIEVNAVEEIK